MSTPNNLHTIPPVDGTETGQVPHVEGHERFPGKFNLALLNEFVHGDIRQHSDNTGEKMTRYTAAEGRPMGYGKADAKISYAKQKAEVRLSDEVERQASGIIESGFCMAKITDKDDGCLDGRGATLAVFPNKDGYFIEEPIKLGEHLRAKVAGGGGITGFAMQASLPRKFKTADEHLAHVVEVLSSQNIVPGTHRGENQEPGRTDCGANDNLEVILRNGLALFDKISGSVKGIYEAMGLIYDESIAQLVKERWTETLYHEGYFTDSTAESRYDVIMRNMARVQRETGSQRPVSTSKLLRGSHNEAFVVVNLCEGVTFSQAGFRAELHRRFPDIDEANLPQSFAIDVPRIVTLAKAIAKGNPDEKAYDTALFAGLAFQFATAATLTDGSLRTFLVTEKS